MQMKGSENGGLTEPAFNVDKLSHQIFSILEAKFLQRPAAGRLRILSIDAGGATNGLLAAAALTNLESSLQTLSGDPSARISDFFDAAAGAGAGALLAALLFLPAAADRPLFSAAEASRFLLSLRQPRTPLLSRIFPKKKASKFGKIFGALTLRDAMKPLLITCVDLKSGAPFLFSRVAALEREDYDFFMRDVCAAAVGGAAEIRSVGGGATTLAAVNGGTAAENPTAAAITHVLNNGSEFPRSRRVEDLFVVSIGDGELAAPAWPSEMTRIVSQFAADMVDQAVSTAFGEARSENYIRIQASVAAKLEIGGGGEEAAAAMAAAEKLLSQKSVESALFQGRSVSQRTNAQKLEKIAEELLKESEARKRCPSPFLLL